MDSENSGLQVKFTDSENFLVETNISKGEEHKNDEINETDRKPIVDKQDKEECMEKKILDAVENCAAIFQSQQLGDPELTTADKRRIADELLNKKPESFLLKFGEFLKEEHINYFLVKFSSSYEVQYYANNLKNLLNDHSKNIIKRNRRFEAMKRMEAEGNYFSEAEMEKREPLLYHQMVGQYLSEKEKLQRNRQAQEDVIPTFSNFLIYKMEREEMNQLVKSQQEEEDRLGKIYSSSEDEISQRGDQKRWGEDWEEERSRKKIRKKQLQVKCNVVSKKEKKMLLQEFQSIMKNNFLSGKDTDFNYSEVDLNPDYDAVDIRTQDEEEKYFDEETYDTTVCTDTGIEDY